MRGAVRPESKSTFQLPIRSRGVDASQRRCRLSPYIMCAALAGCVLSTNLQSLTGSRGALPSWSMCLFVGVCGSLLVERRRLGEVIAQLTMSPAGIATSVLLCYIGLCGVASVAQGDSRFVNSHYVSTIIPLFVVGCLAAHTGSCQYRSQMPSVLTVVLAIVPGVLALSLIAMDARSIVDGRFLVTSEVPLYQTISDFYLLFFVATSCLVLEALIQSPPCTSVRTRVAASLALAASTILGTAAMMFIGSNKGTLAALVVGTIAVYDASRIVRRRSGSTVVISSVVAVLLLFLLRPALDSLGVSTRLNASGPDTDLHAIGSVSSRQEQVTEFLADGWREATLFGRLNLDGYVHSVPISLLTNLGVIGLFLACTAFGTAWIGASRCRRPIARFAALPILLVGAASSYFSWGPLWFLLGLLVMSNRCRHREYTRHRSQGHG